ncbi:energy coupling factor transporter S component ThiW [Chryseomicrobium palamuruense]
MKKYVDCRQEGVGALFAGLLYKYTKRRIMAAGSEVIGTGLLASLVEFYSPGF